MTRFKLVLLLLFGLTFVACSGTSEEVPADLDPPSAIPGSSWIVTNFDDGSGALVDVLDDTEITANFSRETPVAGRLTGNAGCNEYDFEYDVAGEWLGIGTQYGFVTQKFCDQPEGIMEQEQAYLMAIDAVRRWSLDEYTLNMLDNDDEVLVSLRYTGPFEGSGGEDFVVPPDGIEFAYTFDEGEEGWIADFSDLPVDYDPAIYELDYEWRELPDDLGGFGMYMQGHNRSDDLFMFLKREVNGLEPDATYEASFRLVLASNVPEGLSGIGGSPGESVYIKAGASTREPETFEDTDGWYRMNIDKGNQASEGEDMINIGTMANPNLTPDSAGSYELMSLDSAGRDFEVTTDENGVLWLIVGTDSGFEGLTTLYYDSIEVVLAPK